MNEHGGSERMTSIATPMRRRAGSSRRARPRELTKAPLNRAVPITRAVNRYRVDRKRTAEQRNRLRLVTSLINSQAIKAARTVTPSNSRAAGVRGGFTPDTVRFAYFQVAALQFAGGSRNNGGDIGQTLRSPSTVNYWRQLWNLITFHATRTACTRTPGPVRDPRSWEPIR